MKNSDTTIQVSSETCFADIKKIKFKTGMDFFDICKKTKIAGLQVIAVVSVSGFYMTKVNACSCSKPSVKRLAYRCTYCKF